MKRYFVHYWKDFSNTYEVLWADSPEAEAALPAGAERITRREAEELCRRERERRKYDAAFSGYATASIYPADGPDNIENSRHYELRGYIWERVVD